MAEKRVRFDESVTKLGESNSETEETNAVRAFNKKFKNSLDSDEEDDEVKTEKYNVMDYNEFDGEEDGFSRHEDEVKITPFNMKEELEEGHFDKEGNFIFNKEPAIKDSWLDNIDWVEIKQKPVTGDEESSEDESDIDVYGCYEAMMQLMKPDESVQRAIQRLGKDSKPQTKRWKKKGETSTDDSDIKQTETKEKLAQLSSLANKVLTTGDMSIYERTYEYLSYQLKNKSKSKENDMFSEDFVVSSSNETRKPEGPVDTMWEFKWKDTSDAEVYGPYPTQQMINWVQEGYFKEGVWVRQLDKSDKFYISSRIDFEIYV